MIHYLPIQSFTSSVIYWFIRLPIRSFVDWFADSLISLFIDSLINLFIDSLSYCFIYLLNCFDLLVQWLRDQLNNCLFYLFFQSVQWSRGLRQRFSPRWRSSLVFGEYYILVPIRHREKLGYLLMCNNVFFLKVSKKSKASHHPYASRMIIFLYLRTNEDEASSHLACSGAPFNVCPIYSCIY